MNSSGFRIIFLPFCPLDGQEKFCSFYRSADTSPSQDLELDPNLIVGFFCSERKLAEITVWWLWRARQELPGRKIKFSSSRRRSQNLTEFSPVMKLAPRFYLLPRQGHSFHFKALFSDNILWLNDLPFQGAT